LPDQLREEELEALEQYRKGLESAPVLYRAEGTKIEGRPGEPMVFIASEESEDRAGDIISASGWDLVNFKKNPVFLYMHDQTFPAIGLWNNVHVEGKQLLGSAIWDDDDDFAKLIKGKYERGFMRAVSVGFRVFEFEELPRKDQSPNQRPGGLLFKKQELLEISAVAVPANAKALRRALGTRSHFWLPFEVDAEKRIADMHKQLSALRDEVDEVLKDFKVPRSENKQPVIEPPDWDSVLVGIQDLTRANKGDSK